jgi:hypothetical protein
VNYLFAPESPSDAIARVALSAGGASTAIAGAILTDGSQTPTFMDIVSGVTGAIGMYILYPIIRGSVNRRRRTKELQPRPTRINVSLELT